MKIHEFGSVSMGYTFRGAVNPDPDGKVFVFQARDLSRGVVFGDEEARSLSKTSHPFSGYTGHLCKDDILLAARGMKTGAFRSAVFVSSSQNVVASASVYVIRITSQDILPEYVSYYLNSQDGQNAIASIVSGTHIGAVSRKELEKIDIPIPPLRKQEAFVNLLRNLREQQKIIDREKEIKQNIINATFKSLTAK